MNIIIRILIGLITLTAGLHFNTRAATITWTNTAGGNWSTAANWSPNQVPSGTDDAFITNNGTYMVTINATATAGTLTLGGASSLRGDVSRMNPDWIAIISASYRSCGSDLPLSHAWYLSRISV